MIILEERQYEEVKKGYSIFSGEPVTIIGEAIVSIDGDIKEEYLYNIDNYTAKNGKPFMALKCNIHVR